MLNVATRLDYALRVIATIIYFSTSLTTSTLILFYVSFLGSGSDFVRRVRSLISVVTCAPWLICFGIRLAVDRPDLVFTSNPDSRTVNIGTHASHIDGLSMMVVYWMNRHRHIPPCAVVKQEVLFTPFYGLFALFVGNVLVSRGSTKASAVSSMNKAAQRLKEGYVIGGFPEGSRRRTPSCGKSHLLPFKKGIFHMVKNAVDSGISVTIAPFCLVGSRTAWPKGRIVPVSGSKVLLKFCHHISVPLNANVDGILDITRLEIEKGLEAACWNEKSEYDVHGAFGKGTEIDLKKEFLFEAILLTLPPVVTLVLGVFGYFH